MVPECKAASCGRGGAGVRRWTFPLALLLVAACAASAIFGSGSICFSAPAAAPASGLWPELDDPAAFNRLVERGFGGPRGDVRAVYLTAASAGNPDFMAHIYELVATSSINAVVIDVKDNSGHTTYPSQLAAVNEIGAASARIPDLGALMAECEERGIYTIGRLVVFADPMLAKAKPELAVQHVNGGIWRDAAGSAWTNPHVPAVWDYNLAIAAEVASLGCREIQFDYVRFPSDGNLDTMYYPVKQDLRPAEVIEAFLSGARRALAPYGVFTAADVFGLVTSFSSDMRIGQVLENVARQVDFVCPMMYPSHYAKGNYGIPDPDAEPYLTVHTGLTHALARMAGWSTAQLRPWLQDFSWRHRYGPEQVRAEISAAADLGVHGFMLWNASNVYTEDAIR